MIAKYDTGSMDLSSIEAEINRLPKEPSLNRLTDGSFGKLDSVQYEVMKKIAAAHIDSFDFMAECGFPNAVPKIRPLQMELPNGDRLVIKVLSATLYKPDAPKTSRWVPRYRNFTKDGKEKVVEDASNIAAIFPSECRMSNSTYKGKLKIKFNASINGRVVWNGDEVVGEIPIMVKSMLCHLHGKGQNGMVDRKEDADDIGGYFIINGNERLIRFLSAQRRNYPMGLKRPSWKECGQLFSEYGVSIRCVRKTEIGTNMILHYLNNGTARLRVFYDKHSMFFPVVLILKGLVDATDHYIYSAMIRGNDDDSYYVSCCVNMLQLVNDQGLKTHQDVRSYLGSILRDRVRCAPWSTDEEVCKTFLEHSIAPHLENNQEKFDLLIFMLKKLFAIAKGTAALENPDNPMFHETLLPGHIYFALLLDRIDTFLSNVEIVIRKKLEIASRGLKSDGSNLSSLAIKQCLTAKFSDICRPLHTLLSTGNLVSRSGIGLQQISGLSVMAEKINYWRFISNFRAVHRGAFFAQMKTTACRKLYPEAWGFLCPVHTPDGAPCGLLNHLAEMAIISNCYGPDRFVVDALISLGMQRIDALPVFDFKEMIHVLLDGKVVGYIPAKDAPEIAKQLRCMKAKQYKKFPNTLEIGLIPKTSRATQYPGLYLFKTPARMLRPVKNLMTNTVELIGTFEQPYLDICIVPEEAHSTTTHQELRQTAMLSLLATQIPFPDFNQSPRNMYSCQMGKQTMGFASHTLHYRSDHKMYGIVSPQSPLVRPAMHDHYHLDDFPMGTNAVVAVISYTGYDMEDALILNKASVERGFFAGCIIKTELVDLREIARSKGVDASDLCFGRSSNDGVDEKLNEFIDADGLPISGKILNFEDPLYAYIDKNTGKMSITKYKSMEKAHVLDVKVLGGDTNDGPFQKIAIKLFISRIPTIGDKFANRHGQKGVCSFLWPQESMPFTESGMTPDVIFNPHGYPSRMTIGMMIESMAGKAASYHATAYDATPFTFSEQNTASEHYGKLLEDAGFNYYGTERMWSGVDGRLLKADIFIGVLYYIRLRHMVGDKYQVRATGPVDQVTHQPVKGRKRCGGIRFGEMERDSLLAHGASFLLHDRLFHCSDESTAHVCGKCGSFLSTALVPIKHSERDGRGKRTYTCLMCETPEYVREVSVPYVLRYLVAELASVNIKCVFRVKDGNSGSGNKSNKQQQSTNVNGHVNE